MRKDDKDEAVGAAATAAGTAAGLLAADPVMAAVGSGAVSAGVRLAAHLHSRHQNRKAEQWWDAFVARMGWVTDGEAITHAKLRAEEDPDFEARVYHALQAVWVSVDDAVLPALAYLAARYEAEGKPADVFYKRLSRFLQDTTAQDLAWLRTLFSLLHEATEKGAPALLVQARLGSHLVNIEVAGGMKAFTDRSVELGVGCDALLRRLRYEHLVDEGDASSVAIKCSPQQVNDIYRYLVNSLA